MQPQSSGSLWSDRVRNLPDQDKIALIDEFQRLNEGNTKLLCRYFLSPDREKVRWGDVKGKDVKSDKIPMEKGSILNTPT